MQLETYASQPDGPSKEGPADIHMWIYIHTHTHTHIKHRDWFGEQCSGISDCSSTAINSVDFADEIRLKTRISALDVLEAPQACTTARELEQLLDMSCLSRRVDWLYNN